MPRHATETSFKSGESHIHWKGGSYCYWHKKMREEYNVPKGIVIHHINKDYKDNRLSNLLFISQSEHVAIHNRERKGAKHLSCSKYRLHNEIIRLTKQGLPSRYIGKILGIGKTTVLRSRRLKA